MDGGGPGAGPWELSGQKAPQCTPGRPGPGDRPRRVIANIYYLGAGYHYAAWTMGPGARYLAWLSAPGWEPTALNETAVSGGKESAFARRA